MSIIIVLYFFGIPILDLIVNSGINSHQQSTPFLVILGNVQDGGSPHIGCTKSCCAELWENPSPER